MSVQINILNKCYQNCVGCRKPEWPDVKLTDNVVYDVLNWMKQNGGHSVVFSGGDPPAHGSFLEFLEYAHNLGLGTGTLTACLWGKGFDPEKFLRNSTWVSISIDGATEDVYKQTRGVNTLEKAKENIKLLKSIISSNNLTVRLRCNSTISNLNIHQIEDILELCYELGIECNFYPIHTWEDLKLQNIDRNEVIKYVDGAKQFYNKFSVKSNINEFMDLMDRTPPGKCIMPWLHCFVDANGDVTICCRSVGGGQGDNGIFQINQDYNYGNLFESSMETIWNSERAKKLRQTTYNPKFSFCAQCDRYSKNNHDYEKWLNSEDRTIFL